MDRLTVTGLSVGMAMVAAALLFTGETLPMMHLPSLLVTCGGTLAVLLIHFPARRIKNAVSLAGECFTRRIPDLPEVISLFRSYALSARRDGRLSLDTTAAETQDAFLRLGLELTAAETDRNQLRLILEREVVSVTQRYTAGRQLFEVLGAAAPAWGMMGTLTGLYHVLMHLDSPSRLGPGIAMAVLTTLYGSLLSNLVCIPLAGKLENRSMDELAIRQIMIEGFLALDEELSPNSLEERLRVWVPPQQRFHSTADRAA